MERLIRRGVKTRFLAVEYKISISVYYFIEKTSKYSNYWYSFALKMYFFTRKTINTLDV